MKILSINPHPNNITAKSRKAFAALACCGALLLSGCDAMEQAATFIGNVIAAPIIFIGQVLAPVFRAVAEALDPAVKAARLMLAPVLAIVQEYNSVRQTFSQAKAAIETLGGHVAADGTITDNQNKVIGKLEAQKDVSAPQEPNPVLDPNDPTLNFPANFSATPNSSGDAVTLDWIAPVAGGPVDHYDVFYCPHGAVSDPTGQSPTITLESYGTNWDIGVPWGPGVAVDFWVRSNNGTSDGKWVGPVTAAISGASNNCSD